MACFTDQGRCATGRWNAERAPCVTQWLVEPIDNLTIRAELELDELLAGQECRAQPRDRVTGDGHAEQLTSPRSRAGSREHDVAAVGSDQELEYRRHPGHQLDGKAAAERHGMDGIVTLAVGGRVH